MPFGVKLLSSSARHSSQCKCFVHNFVAVIVTHDLYIYVAVILLRLSYFQLCVKFVSVFTVLSALWHPPRSALIANCNIEASNLGTEKLSLTI